MKRSPRLLFSRTGDLTLPFYQISLSPVLVSANLDLLSSVVKYTLGFLYYSFFFLFFLITRLKSRVPSRRAVKVCQILYLECCQHDEILKTTFSAEMKPPNLTRRRLAVECLTSLTTANYKPRSPTDPNSPRALHLSPTLRYVPAK